MSTRRTTQRAAAPRPQRSTQVDLARLFGTVATTLKENQQSLNEMDEYNHNHGDNMVDSFQVITKAVRAKKGCPPAEQLEYASQLLNQRAQSGSAQLYAQGLSQAAGRMQGKTTVSQEDAMLLVQALMGGGQAAAEQPQAGGMEDILGALLGGQAGQQQSAQPSGGDMLGGLLGGLLGGATGGQPSGDDQPGGGIDLNMLLSAGMAFYQARQQGAEPLQALVQAVMAGSQMQSSAHRSQSGQLVAGTLIESMGKMLSGRRR